MCLLLLGTSPASTLLNYRLLIWVPRAWRTSPSGPYPTAQGPEGLFWGSNTLSTSPALTNLTPSTL